MDDLTPKKTLKKHPSTLQNPPKNTRKYPPNPPQNILLPRCFLSGEGITMEIQETKRKPKKTFRSSGLNFSHRIPFLFSHYTIAP